MAGTIRIAILANAAQAKAELASISTSAGRIGDKFAKFRAPAAAALGAIGLGASKAISSASDLNETVSKSNQIFGSNAGAITAWAGGAAKNLGLSKQAALESAAGFGDMFSQLGFAGDQAAKMSQQVVQTSADLGSFNNLPTADVADKIAGAMRGEYDSLQQLIPNISAARVQSEAMAATGKTSASALTAQEKATATLAIIQKDGARAQGDFARTSTGAANSQKIAAASAQDLAAGLGQQLLPAYTAVVQKLTAFLGFLNQHQTAVGVVVAVVGTLAAAVLAFSAAQAIVNTVMGAAKIAMAAYTVVQWALNAAMTANPIGIIVVGLALLIAGLVLAYKKSETFRNIVNAAFKAVGVAAKAVWDAIKAAAVFVWNFITGYIKFQIKIITTVVKTIVAVAKAVWNGIKTAASAVWNALKAGFALMVSTVKGKFGDLKSAASSVLSKIKSLFSPSALVHAGAELMAGLARGIAGAIGRAVDAVRAGVQKIKNLLPGSPIKDGPLKSWNNGGAGKRLMALLAGGIQSGSGQVRTSLANALDPATSLSGMSVGVGGGGATYQITVQTGVGDPIAIGKGITDAISAYERAGGRKRA